MILKLGGKRVEAIATGYIIRALKIELFRLETRPCASKEWEICHYLSRISCPSGQPRLSQPAPEQYALVAGHVDGNDCRGMVRF